MKTGGMNALRALLLACLLGLGFALGGRAAPIVWDPATLTLVSAGGLYGRMTRLPGGAILCVYEQGGKSWARRSRDGGRTWSAPVIAAQFPYAGAANPEVLALKNGDILLFVNQRPGDGTHPFAIGEAVSRDGGASWTPRPNIYEAGTTGREGCWEPSALQLPSGEIQLFFANNFPYKGTDDQDISLCRSQDNGKTWSAAKPVSYRARHRDGMPVPLRLQNGDIALAIEDSGLTSRYTLQPAAVTTSRRDNWREPFADGASPRRRGALASPLPADVYAGAPYLRQMPGGQTVLSCQQGLPGQNDRDPRLFVYVGDRQARNFAQPTQPFAVPGQSGGELWNSLFVKDAYTITAITSTTINGVGGLWAIDGRVGSNG